MNKDNDESLKICSTWREEGSIRTILTQVFDEDYQVSKSYFLEVDMSDEPEDEYSTFNPEDFREDV